MKRLKLILAGAFLVSAFGMVSTSCSTDEALTTCPECQVLERTDITITGAINQVDFQTCLESDPSVDLVSYNFYGPSAAQIDFKVQLISGEQLLITLMDREVYSPWKQVGKAYNAYPGWDLEDKLSYVSVDFLNKETGVSFTNDQSSVQGISLDVFRVEENNSIQMRCRLRDMELHSVSDANKSIVVNGTIVGAITF